MAFATEYLALLEMHKTKLGFITNVICTLHFLFINENL